MTEQFTFFWRSESPFSHWHPSKFTVDRITFDFGEQYMMWKKAMLFGDHATADRILRVSHPRDMKALGRQVQGFVEAIWLQVARPIVFVGNFAKFTQNRDLLQKLMDTDGTTLVEASPYDKLWGIGLAASDPRAQNRETWLGTNWLGEDLTMLRDGLWKSQMPPMG